MDLSDKAQDFESRRKDEQKRIDKLVKRDVHEVEEVYEAGNLSEEQKVLKLRQKILKMLQEMNKTEAKTTKIATQSASTQQVANLSKEIAKSVGKSKILKNLCFGILDKNVALYKEHEE